MHKVITQYKVLCPQGLEGINICIQEHAQSRIRHNLNTESSEVTLMTIQHEGCFTQLPIKIKFLKESNNHLMTIALSWLWCPHGTCATDDIHQTSMWSSLTFKQQSHHGTMEPTHISWHRRNQCLLHITCQASASSEVQRDENHWMQDGDSRKGWWWWWWWVPQPPSCSVLSHHKSGWCHGAQWFLSLF